LKLARVGGAPRRCARMGPNWAAAKPWEMNYLADKCLHFLDQVIHWRRQSVSPVAIFKDFEYL
jgi:hypothetical protein